MLKINPHDHPGPWERGVSLDLHTVKSVPLGENEHGHMQFETTRTELGQRLYSLKYGQDAQMIEEVAKTAAAFGDDDWPIYFDFVTGVPATTNRAVQPVHRLCEAIAAELKYPYYRDAIVAVAGGPPLKEITDAEERVRALSGRFRANPVRARGKDVLLIDDLYRSGSTAAAATQALMDAGAGHVYLLAMTRTRSNK